MLVLSRKRGETINVGSDITVTVVAMNGDRVRIGIEAPKDTEITRPDMIKTKQDDKVANSNK